MSMFGPKAGTWSIYSDTDPRWNKSGRIEWLVSLGYPKVAEDWIEECKQKYGDQPPDLTYSFWKD